LLQYAVFGVIDGAFLLLATLGFALVSRVHQFLNIAHAELMSISALLTWWFSGGLHLPIWLAALIAIIVVAVLGLGIGRVVYEPMLVRGPAIMLIVSVGVVYLIHGVTEGIVPPGIKSLPLPDLPTIYLGSVRVTVYQLIIVVIAVLSFVGLHLFLSRTRVGTAVRAVSANRELARVRGVDVERATRYVWLIASGLAGLAGVALALVSTLTTDLAFEQILLILSVSILAGLGSIYGVALSAMIIGLTMDLSTVLVPSGYRTAVAFVVIIAVLVFRPRGLFGRKVRLV